MYTERSANTTSNIMANKLFLIKTTFYSANTIFHHTIFFSIRCSFHIMNIKYIREKNSKILKWWKREPSGRSLVLILLQPSSSPFLSNLNISHSSIVQLYILYYRILSVYAFSTDLHNNVIFDLYLKNVFLLFGIIQNILFVV